MSNVLAHKPKESSRVFIHICSAVSYNCVFTTKAEGTWPNRHYTPVWSSEETLNWNINMYQTYFNFKSISIDEI
jgi:hypothetical protein